MVEVFRTNITDVQVAKAIAKAIRHHYPAYKVSFDLDDCDKILRVANAKPDIEYLALFNIAQSAGVEIEVLPE